MAKLIDASIQGAVSVEPGFKLLKGFYVRVAQGWSGTVYFDKDIVQVAEIEAETYRSGGKAAAGAIIGGLLTGGIGLLAGAALGGRRRMEASYLIHLSDGNHVAFTTKDKLVIKHLGARALRQQVARQAADSAPDRNTD
jgi:hypothetical protein